MCTKWPIKPHKSVVGDAHPTKRKIDNDKVVGDAHPTKRKMDSDKGIRD
jgi:hypothetical protein